MRRGGKSGAGSRQEGVRAVGEAGGGRASLLPPARAAGRGLGPSRRQMSAAPVGTTSLPQHTGPRTDSDLPQNQPSASSLTSWPGHSITARPPRRTQWPASPGSRAGGWGQRPVTAGPRLPRCPPSSPEPFSAHVSVAGAAGRRRRAPGARGQRPWAAWAEGHWGAQKWGRGGPLEGGRCDLGTSSAWGSVPDPTIPCSRARYPTIPGLCLLLYV